jgi:hypothetical protein
MKTLILLLALIPAFAGTGAAFAQQPQQQPADPAFMQKAIQALQTQRNQALDAQAVVEAKAMQLADEVAKLKTELDELKKKPEPQK